MSSVARLFGLACVSVLSIALTARGAGPADDLLRLVPPDAAATLAVEDLRGQARELFGSPLAEGFRRSPAFRAWLASDHFRKFDGARQQIEKVVGEKIATIRDNLLGDAFVLTLRVPPEGQPEQARGLLLARVRDRPLLDRLIHEFNAAQTRSGELTRLLRTDREGVAYWTREFRPDDRRPAEYFTVLVDNTFAWSNAEDLVQGVIDRKAGKARSLDDRPEFQRVRRRLADQATVSLFLEPGFLRRLLSDPARPKRPAGDHAAALLGRYLGAMDYFGATLRWRDGVWLQTEEILDPGKLDPWVRCWAARPAGANPGSRRVPATALAAASLQVDFPSLLSAFRDFVPDTGQARVENLIVALNGVLLGHDLETDVLPRLGPEVLTYLEPPAADNRSPAARLSKVTVVNLGDANGLTASVENALRTTLALYALDARHGQGQLRVESRETAGRNVTRLRPTSPFTFAIDGDRLVLGSSSAAVVRALDGTHIATAGTLEKLRAARFPKSGTFASVDLQQLHEFVLSHRGPIVERLAARQQRPVADMDRDLDQALALIALFRQAYLTSAVEPDATAVHRSLGLVERTYDAGRASAP